MSVRKLADGTEVARELLPFLGILMVALLTVFFVSTIGAFVLV